MTIIFDIYVPGELAAGIRPVNETIRMTVDSGDPGGGPDEFAEHMRQALGEWYDGGKVVAHVQR